MKPGEAVLVTEYGGKTLERRVVADRGQTVEICNEREYETAIAEGRRPRGVGFPRRDVVGLDTSQ